MNTQNKNDVRNSFSRRRFLAGTAAAGAAAMLGQYAMAADTAPAGG